MPDTNGLPDSKTPNPDTGILRKILGSVTSFSKEILQNFIGLFQKTPLGKSRFYEIDEDRFVKEGARIIAEHMKAYEKCLIITFDIETRDLHDAILRHGVNPKRLYYIDCISYNQGHGTPPVPNIFCTNRPEDFENIYMYTVVHEFLMKTKNACVFIVRLSNLLKFTSFDEIGVFLEWYRRKLEDDKMPLIQLYPKSGDNMLKGIVKRNLNIS